MDRQEFSKLLVECRKETGLSITSVAKKIKKAFPQMLRIERASGNYYIDVVFQYIQAINYTMVIYDHINGESFYVCDRERFKTVYKAMRAIRNLTQVEAAKKIGVYSSVITGIENQDKNTSIDMFLKCIYGLDYEIKLIKKEEV